MIVVLYGPDSYRKNEKMAELISSYRKKYGEADIIENDMSAGPSVWKGIKDAVRQPSMFVRSKVVILSGGTSVDDGEWIAFLRKQTNTSGVTILMKEEKKPSGKFSFLLKKPVLSQEFPELSGGGLEKFLKEESMKLRVGLNAAERKAFLSFLEKQECRTWVCVRELEKLFLLRAADGIGEGGVAYASERAKEQVFSLGRKILSSRSPRDALVALETLFLQRESPAYLFNSIAYQAGGADLISFADYDVAVKSGKLEYEEVFLDYCLKK